MSSFPALRYGLEGRGLLRKGYHADIAVVDPEAATDTATFQDPHQYAKGMDHVLVNGVFAVEDGEFTGRLAGKTLRHGGS
jgi:N-acyl-D-amino-acid deacylase